MKLSRRSTCTKSKGLCVATQGAKKAALMKVTVTTAARTVTGERLKENQMSPSKKRAAASLRRCHLETLADMLASATTGQFPCPVATALSTRKRGSTM